MSTITGTDQVETLTGGDDADIIVGLGGGDTIEGMAGNDTIWGGLSNTFDYEGTTYTRFRFADEEAFDMLTELGLRGSFGQYEYFKADNGDLIAFDYEESFPVLFFQNEYDNWSKGNDYLLRGYTVSDPESGAEYGWISESDYEDDGVKYYMYGAQNFSIEVIDQSGLDFLELLGVGDPNAYTIDDVASFSLTRSFSVNENGHSEDDVYTISHFADDGTFLGSMQVDLEDREAGDMFRTDASGTHVAIDAHPHIETILDGMVDFVDGFVASLAPDNADSGVDRLVGGDGADFIHGGIGNDELVGFGGDDTLVGGVGDDDIHGGDGNDLLEGYYGRDHLYGGAGDDTIYASGSVTPSIYDDIDETQVYDGAGNDTVIGVSNGGLGIDIHPGSGDDYYESTGDNPGGERINFLWRDEGEATETIVVRYTSEMDGIIENDGYGGRDEFKGFMRVTASHNADELYGADGEQRLWGRDGDDTIYGFGGDDDLRGEGGDDLIYGGDGDDQLNDGIGTDTLDGGEGFDTFRRNFSDDYDDYSFTAVVDLSEGKVYAPSDPNDYDTLVSIEATALYGNFNHNVIGNDDDNRLNTGAGNDTLVGGAGDDDFFAGEGDDYISGGDGNDWQHGGGGDDTISGGAGRDAFVILDADSRLTIEDYEAQERIVLNSPFQFETAQLRDHITARYDSASDTTILSIEVEDAASEDMIFVKGRFELYTVLREDDGDVEVKLAAPGTPPPLDQYGDNGDNLLEGGDGNDSLYGRGGNDTFIGNGGDDRLYGEDGNDSLLGSDGDDQLLGGLGSDTIDGGDGYDRLAFWDREYAQGVTVDLTAGTATDNDTGDVDQLSNIENVSGSNASDRLVGDDNRNGIDGNEGNDTITGNGGDDNLWGREGDDSIVGGDGDDDLRGQEGNDTLKGGAGRDHLRGGDGDDYLDASEGDAESQDYGDMIQAGLGNDTIIGHQRAWELRQEGIDRSNGQSHSGLDVLYDDPSVGFTAGITVVFSGENGSGTVASRGSDNFTDTFTYADRIEGTQFADHITGSNARAESFVGEAGDDTIDGGTAYDGETNRGWDTIDYRYEYSSYSNGEITPQGVLVDLAEGYATDTFGDRDTLINFEGAFGSHLNDKLLGTDGINYLWGEDGNDTIEALGGDDWISAGHGDDLVLGGAGNDTLDGMSGDDYLFGQEGDDVIMQTGSGTQYYDGGDGNDTFITEADKFDYDYNGFIAQVNLTTGFSGTRDEPNHRLNDRVVSIENVETTGEWLWELIGDQGANRLSTDRGDDSLWGLSGNDTLDAGAGDDILVGGLGNDMIFAGQGTDIYYGGEGEDNIDFSYLGNAGVIVDTSSGIATGGNTFSGFEGYVGTSGNDMMTGRDTSIGTNSAVERNAVFGTTDNYELFRAGDGNDTIDGAGGYDEVAYGNVSVDLIIDLTKTDAQDVRGDGSEMDTILNVEGVEGGSGNDTIIGNSGDNSLDGRFGNNVIDGGAGVDFVEYNGSGRTNVVVDLSAGQSTFTRSSNDEQFIDTLSNIEGVIGSTSGDDITGDNGDNILYGVQESDTIDGGAGDDTISGGAGSDRLIGGEGRDVFLYNEGDGRDTIVGFNMDEDTITSDLEYTIYREGNSDNAIAMFENGSFTYLENLETSAQLVSAEKTGNTLAVSEADVAISNVDQSEVVNNANFDNDDTTNSAMANAGNVQRATLDLNEVTDQGGSSAVSLTSIASEDSAEAIILDVGDSETGENLTRTIEVNNYSAIAVEGEAKLRGGEGDNTFLGDDKRQDVNLGAGDDYLSGGGGDDTIGSSGGDDTILGGGDDDIVFGGIGNDSVDGGADDDHVGDALGNDVLLGGAGNDTIRSFDGGDIIDGGSGNDVIYGGYGADDISGGAGADKLYGDTVLFASRGNDTLDGGSGNDLLQGGFGADTFVFNVADTGSNTITRIDGGGRDFETGLDLIELNGFNVTSDTVMDQISENASGDAVFSMSGVSITFDGVSASDLTASDFDIV